jgi:hypothetical protein
LSHTLGLNEICDTLQNHSGILTIIREATPPSRNGFSHANRNRNADMAEDLFWKVLEHLEKLRRHWGQDLVFVFLMLDNIKCPARFL